jgi:hypothetical protein
MAEVISIPPSSLLIDAENPRLPQPNTGQREALRALADHQQRKILALARDIVLYGLNPTDLPIVMATNDDLKRYVVLEGNRRLSALKGLENPDSLVGTIDGAALKELRTLSKQYHQVPIDSVQCVVVKTRDEARHWIELRHTGLNEGAGIWTWGSDEVGRFRFRIGEEEIHTQALNLLEKLGELTPEERRAVPASSLKRLLNTPEVRQKCGIDWREGKLLLLAKPQPIAKAILYIVNALVSGRTKTKDIYNKAHRLDFANSLPANVVVEPTLKGGKAAFGKTRKTPAAKPKLPRVREHLIPSDCTLSVSDVRISQIETELRMLSLETYTNAVSVLFRVFLELSVDAYIVAKTLGNLEPQSLSAKMKAVVEDMLAKQKLTTQQAVPVRRAMQKDSFLAPSLTMMHKYLHNHCMFPAPSDLRQHWNSLQPFIVAIWSP